MDTDCGVGNACLTLAVGFPLPTEEVHVCAQACTTSISCEVPPGSYTASVACVDDGCRLDCAPLELFGELLTCPTGFSCESDLSGASYCYR
jgi:hypothetical protein